VGIEPSLVWAIEAAQAAGTGVPAHVIREVDELRAEVARLLRMLKLTRTEAVPPGPEGFHNLVVAFELRPFGWLPVVKLPVDTR
jgi:hypothetical protein